VRRVVAEEAAAQGKTAVVADFYKAIRLWGKSGSYSTCLGDPADMSQCGQEVHIGARAGLVAMPLGPKGTLHRFRHYSYALPFSDVPVNDDTSADRTLTDAQVQAFKKDVNPELLRQAIREALLEW
jgi:hypothetical protein